MNENILIELAVRWEHDAVPPEIEVEEELIVAEYHKGQRETKRECADTLRTLIAMLGTRDNL